jgi:hypothetical protein
LGSNPKLYRGDTGVLGVESDSIPASDVDEQATIGVERHGIWDSAVPSGGGGVDKEWQGAEAGSGIETERMHTKVIGIDGSKPAEKRLVREWV